MNVHNDIFYQNCLKLGLNVECIKEIDAFRLRIGDTHYLYQNAHVSLNDCSGSIVSSDKFYTNHILAQANIPVPKSILLEKKDYYSGGWTLGELKYPLVAKPTFGTSLGHDVVCGIEALKDLDAYLHERFEQYDMISIEEFIGGLKSYRVLVLTNKVIGVVERTPATIEGTGSHSLKELVEHENIKRSKKRNETLQGYDHEMLYDIELNEETNFILKKKGITLDHVPDQGERIALRYACNRGLGGTAYSHPTSIICKENQLLAVKAASALNLEYAGLDILCQDISLPIEQSNGVIIEINSNPSITIHEKPFKGIPCCVTKAVLRKHLAQHPWERFKKVFKKCIVPIISVILCLEIAWHTYLTIGI